MDTVSFTTSYMDAAVFDLEHVLNLSQEILTPHLDEFDTLVGTGFSGGLVIPALALRLGKTFVLIRKEDDDSHHGGGRLLGELGERWMFVDDFTQSGATLNRVLEKIEWAAECQDYETQHVANYFYVGPNVYERVPPVEKSETKVEKQPDVYEYLDYLAGGRGQAPTVTYDWGKFREKFYNNTKSFSKETLSVDVREVLQKKLDSINNGTTKNVFLESAPLNGETKFVFRDESFNRPEMFTARIIEKQTKSRVKHLL